MSPDYTLPVVPGYEVLEQVAAGGRAEIYLAREKREDGQLVAVKFLKREDIDDVDKVQAFMDEVELTKLLVHPTIVRVFHGEFTAGLPYLVMEFVDGITLYEMLERVKGERRQLPFGVAAYLVANVADALSYAHAQPGPDGEPLKLVHRDVSAVNIMVTFDGAVKLLDFGIARSKISSVRTAPGIIKGKLDYLSPEQCSGGTIDGQTDIYSLGVVLYELLTGRRPFEEERLGAQLDKVCKGDRPKVRALRPDVPPRLERIVDRAMAVNRSKRYQTASEMLEDLRAFMDKLPSRPTSSTVAQLLGQLVPDKLTRIQESYGPEDTTSISALDAVGQGQPRARSSPLPPSEVDLEVELEVEVEETPSPPPAPPVELPRRPSRPAEPPSAQPPSGPGPEPGPSPMLLPRTPADRRRAGILLGLAGMIALAMVLGVAVVKISRCLGPEDPVEPEARAVAGTSKRDAALAPRDAGPASAADAARGPEAGAARSKAYAARDASAAGDAEGDDAGDGEAGAVLDFTQSPGRDGGGGEADREVGYLTVTTRRPAQVFLRGERLGLTPIERRALPPGRYRVKVRNSEGVRRQWVRIRAGREVRVEFRL